MDEEIAVDNFFIVLASTCATEVDRGGRDQLTRSFRSIS